MTCILEGEHEEFYLSIMTTWLGIVEYVKTSLIIGVPIRYKVGVATDTKVDGEHEKWLWLDGELWCPIQRNLWELD